MFFGKFDIICYDFNIQIRIVHQNDEMLLAACQQLLDKSEEEVGQIALEKLVTHQNDVIRQMTVKVSGMNVF